MAFTIFSSLFHKHLIRMPVFIGLFFCILAMGFTSMAFAQDPVGVSFTLEGCRDPSVDLELTNFVCADGDYTTGNLGKSWNELDLVPHRVTASAGNSAPNTQTYIIAIVADYSDVDHPGYDVISEPVINPVSDSSCSVVVGSESHAVPGLGGIDDSLYRLLTITQDKNTICVFDYYQRLAVGSHLFPGSSLHSNLGNQSLGTAGIGSKEVSIPVKDILSQGLEKDMTATQDTDYTWNITKGATPASLDIENACCPTTPLELEVKLYIEWEIIPTSSDMVTVVTNIYAVNPAHRSITVNVTDEIFGTLGIIELSLDIRSSGDVDVPPNTTQLVFTHIYDAPSNLNSLKDVATATYIDKVTGIEVPGQTTAIASAPIQPGAQTNTTATIIDVESISGEGFSFSVDSVAGSTGGFQGGYTLGTPTQDDVTWISDTQNDNGYVEFTKTLYLDEPRITTGKIADVAILNGSDGFEASTPINVNITADAKVDLTIINTIPDVLDEGETASFTFEVRRLDDLSLIETVIFDFVFGELSKSINLTGLDPGGYLVEEVSSSPAGWQTLPPQEVYITLPECSGEVTFQNQTSPAQAKAKKATIPGGYEEGWEFTLYRMTQSGSELIEKGETDIQGTLLFTALLENGTYKIIETPKEGWDPEDGTECIFDVDLPEDAGKCFECSLENRFKPTIEFDKTGDEFSKAGDMVDYTLTLKNTSSAGGPALNCTITDTMLGIDESVTLDSGQTHQIPASYKVQDTDPDPLLNTAEVSCIYSGNQCVDIVAEASSSWSVELLHPDYTVSKECPDYPIPQEGPAIFTIIFQNTGDVELSVVADEDLEYDGNIILTGTPFTLPVGMTKAFEVIIDGAFSTQETVTNTIHTEATLPEWTGLDNVLKRSGEDTCNVGGRVNALKLTNGVINPEQEWNFKLTGPGLPEEGVQDTTLGDPDGILDFEYNGFPANLDPSGKYTICELEVLAAWFTEWKVDTNGDGIADMIITPYNPNANDDPPEDLGVSCFDFGAGTPYPIPQGGTLVFEINNTYPEGGPRTPGYWKNWNTCSKGNQQYTAAANGGPEEGWYLLDDILNDPGISWGDFIIATCEDGVNILDKRDFMTGKKMAKDAAYKLASHLLAAQLNFAAGAKTCQETLDAALDAESLLISLGFNGIGNYLSSKDSNYQTAIDLAETLDQYNNGMLCNMASVSISKDSTSSSSNSSNSNSSNSSNNSVIVTQMGLNFGSGLIPSFGIALNTPVGISTSFSSPFGLGNTFSGAFGVNTGFSPPFGLALAFGQSADFSMPFGLGKNFSGPFGLITGLSPPFGLAVGQSAGFNPPFGKSTGFSPPFGLALGKSADFFPPFGYGTGFYRAFGMNPGFSQQVGTNFLLP